MDYFVKDKDYEADDIVRIYSTLLMVDHGHGLWKDDPVYKVVLNNFESFMPLYDGVAATKYSSLKFGEQVTTKFMAECGFIVVRDDQGRIVHYHNRIHDVSRSFSYPDQESNHE